MVKFHNKWKWASGKSRNWNKRLSFFDGTSKRNKETPVKEKVFWSVAKFSWILAGIGILIVIVGWGLW